MEELVITEKDHFKNLILSWSNKFRRQFEDTEVLIKEEKNGGYSRVVVDTSRKYSKKLEMFTLYLSYGHWTESRCSSTLILPRSRIMTYYFLIMTHCSIRIQSWHFPACRGHFLPLYKVCKENDSLYF